MSNCFAMKRHRDYVAHVNSSLNDDVIHGRKHSLFNRPRKALLRRPNDERIKLNDQNHSFFRESVMRTNVPKKLPKSDYLFENFSNSDGVRKLSTNPPIRSDNKNQSQTSIDPLLAVAAVAAELQKSKSANFLPLSRGSSQSAATVAAVAAAMNAAAMAAALGAGNVFGNKPFADLGKAMACAAGSSMPKQATNNNMTPSSSRTNRKPIGTDDALYHSKTSKKVGSAHSNRFPHHLDHRDPEDDPSATRTLFVGNLPPDVTVDELRELFERYGLIEDIDIKRRDPESGITSYAFIRYVNLDMAHRAKIDMSGQAIGEFICKIGYGKVVPTQCLWVGGLGPWITYPEFATLLDKLRPQRIIWPSGKNYANVLFPSIEMATVAANVLRGYPLGGYDRRIRVDFTNEEHMVNDPLLARYKTDFMQRSHQRVSNSRLNRDSRFNSSVNSRSQGSGRSKREAFLEDDTCFSSFRKRPSSYKTHQASYIDEVNSKVLRTHDSSYDLLSGSSNHSRSQSHSPISKFCNTLETATNIKQLSLCLTTMWDANFFLKSSCFPCCMHLLRGDRNLVDQFIGSTMKSTQKADAFHNDKSQSNDICLRITQRMRLDSSKLDDITQRIESCGNAGFCILLALPSSGPPLLSNQLSLELQKQPCRPLRNLVAYLKTKDSAGVVLLNQILSPESKATDDRDLLTGMLHTLPPCEFSFNLLKESATALQKDDLKDDYLVVLLIRNTSNIL